MHRGPNIVRDKTRREDKAARIPRATRKALSTRPWHGKAVAMAEIPAPPASSALNANLTGAAFMMASMAGFATNDALMKGFAADFGLFPSVFWRGVIALCVLAALAHRQGAFRWRPARRDRGLLVLRAGAEALTTIAFLSALLNLPLATATAIVQSTPLVVTLAAALFLGERGGWRRYLAAALGFFGVLLIVQPSAEGISVHMVLALAAVFGITLRDLATRAMSGGAPTVFIALVAMAAITMLGLAGSLAEGPPPLPDLRTALGLTAAAAALIVGFVAGIRAVRIGAFGFIAPFRYSIMIWALILGLAFFGERPDALTLLGSAIVVGTGLFTFARERAVARRSP